MGAHGMCSFFIEKDDLCMVSPITQRQIYRPTSLQYPSLNEGSFVLPYSAIAPTLAIHLAVCTWPSAKQHPHVTDVRVTRLSSALFLDLILIH